MDHSDTLAWHAYTSPSPSDASTNTHRVWCVMDARIHGSIDTPWQQHLLVRMYRSDLLTRMCTARVVPPVKNVATALPQNSYTTASESRFVTGCIGMSVAW